MVITMLQALVFSTLRNLHCQIYYTLYHSHCCSLLEATQGWTSEEREMLRKVVLIHPQEMANVFWTHLRRLVIPA